MVSERVVLRWHHIRHPHPGGPERNQRLSVELDGKEIFSYPPQPYLSRQVAKIVANLIGQESIPESNLFSGGEIEFD